RNRFRAATRGSGHRTASVELMYWCWRALLGQMLALDLERILIQGLLNAGMLPWGFRSTTSWTGCAKRLGPAAISAR
ncbi:MAG TPA: hypothetical protein VMA31_09260, partial [Bryobacteraceae bacterium]|nr:hypothetical protein [Bryobacteraceae bacterium]